MLSKLKRAIAPILSAAMLVSALSPAWAASEGHTRADFSDVPPSHWAYDAVMYCADKGFISGTGDNQFKPDDTITGQEFAIVLLRICLSDEQIAEYTAQIRADEDYVAAYEQSDWAYLPLMIAGKCHFYSIGCYGYDSYYREHDISKGRWRGPITRDDIACKLVTALEVRGEYDIDGFNLRGALTRIKDGGSIYFNGKGSKVEIGAVLAYGLMCGDQYGCFNPDSYMTRAEACEVFMRLDNPAEREVIKAAMGIPPVRGPITIDMRTPEVPHEYPIAGDTVIRLDGTSVVLERVAVNPNDPDSAQILGYGQNTGAYLGTQCSNGNLVYYGINTGATTAGWSDPLADGAYMKSPVAGQESTYHWTQEWALIRRWSSPNSKGIKGTDGQLDSTGLWKYWADVDSWVWQGPHC